MRCVHTYNTCRVLTGCKIFMRNTPVVSIYAEKKVQIYVDIKCVNASNKTVCEAKQHRTYIMVYWWLFGKQTLGTDRRTCAMSKQNIREWHPDRANSGMTTLIFASRRVYRRVFTQLVRSRGCWNISCARKTLTRMRCAHRLLRGQKWAPDKPTLGMCSSRT